ARVSSGLHKPRSTAAARANWPKRLPVCVRSAKDSCQCARQKPVGKPPPLRHGESTPIALAAAAPLQWTEEINPRETFALSIRLVSFGIGVVIPPTSSYQGFQTFRRIRRSL